MRSSQYLENKPFLNVVAESLNLPKLRVVALGGCPVAAERQQRGSGSHLVALSPGVVVGDDRDTQTNTLPRKEGIEAKRSSAPNSVAVAIAAMA